MRETPKARQAWADYTALGPDRSLERLAEGYQRSTEGVPTRQLSRLKKWSLAFGWQGRLREIADREAAAAEERQAAYLRELMETGYALTHERIRLLKALIAKLEADLLDAGRTWVREPKTLGAAIVHVERFNTPELEQLRGLLDDVAKEMGQRRAAWVIAGDRKNPVEVNTHDRADVSLDLAKLSDEELDGIGVMKTMEILDTKESEGRG